MASSIINSDDGVVSGTSGIKTTGGDDGSLNIQANGVDAIVIDNTGLVSFPVGAASGFDSGTVMLFGQTAAPTGWTKDTTNYNNSGLRVVTGTASTGGTVDFTTAFASKAVAGTVSITAISGSAGNTTLTVPQIPSHRHGIPAAPGPQTLPGLQTNWAGFSNRRYQTGSSNTGGSGAHSHPFSFSSGTATFSGTAIDLAVKYVDVIRATKD
jgi:hypothetical protein